MTMPRGGGGFNLGNAYGEVIIDPSRALSGIDAAERSVQSFGQRIGGALSGVGNSMAGLGAGLTTLTAPLAAFQATGVRTAMNFEDALKEIEVRAGLSAEQVEAVRQRAMELGRDTQYGPVQAADAFLQLLTSGSSLEEAMLQIDAVLMGASASGAELGYTADALTDIMAAFGLEAADSRDVMQQIVAASGASSATFPDLINGFANIGPMARLMGLSVEDTAAILAVFSENGIKGAEAGTQLRSMLNNMTRDVPATRAVWERLGINIFDAGGNIRDVNELVQEMNVSMADMTEQERVGIIQELAGSYGQLGLSALLANDGFDEMRDSMREQGDIADIAASRLETASGAATYLAGSLELLQVNALTPLLQEAIRPMLLRMAEVVNQMNEWITANPELANQIVRVLAKVTALGPALFIAGQALAGIGAVIGFVLSPFGLLVGAVGALAYAFHTDFGGIATFAEERILPALRDFAVIAREAFGDFVGYARRIGQAVGPLFEEVGTFVSGLDFGAIWDALQPFFDLMRLTNPFGWLLTIIEALDIDVLQVFEDISRAATDFFATLNGGQGAAEGLTGALGASDWVSGFMSALQQVSAFIVDPVIATVHLFIQTLAGIWEYVSPALGQLAGWFVADVIPQAVGIIVSALQLFGDILSDVWTVAAPYLAQLADWFLYSALPAIQAFISDTMLPAIQGFIDILQDIWDAVSPHLLAFADWFLQDVLPLIVQFIEEIVVPAVQGFIGLLVGIWDAISPALGAMFDWFNTTGMPIIQGILERITDIVSGFIDLLAGLWAIVGPALQPLIDFFLTGMQAVADFIGGALTAVFEGFLNLVDTLLEGIQWVIDGLLQILGLSATGTGRGLARTENANALRDLSNSRGMSLPPAIPDEFVGAFAMGTNYVPHDGLAYVHQGEAIIPANQNRGGLNIQSITVHANTPAEGRAAAAALADELEAIFARSGVNYSMGAI